MIGFIIIGHGEFATGIYSACKLVDKTYSNVKAIDFLDKDSNYELEHKIKLALSELTCYKDIIVFCDIFLESNFRLSLINSIYDYDRFTILSGVNLPIVLEGIMIGQYNKCNAVKLVETLKNEFPNTFIHMLN